VTGQWLSWAHGEGERPGRRMAVVHLPLTASRARAGRSRRKALDCRGRASEGLEHDPDDRDGMAHDAPWGWIALAGHGPGAYSRLRRCAKADRATIKPKPPFRATVKPGAKLRRDADASARNALKADTYPPVATRSLFVRYLPC
jgi:hypothetical protein